MSWIIDNPERVTAIHDEPVLRNLLITQGDHELSMGFAQMLGRENVSWITFASWSSNEVRLDPETRTLKVIGYGRPGAAAVLRPSGRRPRSGLRRRERRSSPSETLPHGAPYLWLD